MIIFDLVIVTGSVYYFSGQDDLFSIKFYLYLSTFWLILSYFTNFYRVFRYTHILKLLSLLVYQIFVFILAFFAYFTLFEEGEVVGKQFNIVSTIIILITVFKLLSFFLLKSYRLYGKNYRNVVVFGVSKSSTNVASLFNKKQDLGYRFKGFFSDREVQSEEYLGTIDDGLKFITDQDVDEVYCEVDSLTKEKLKKIRFFCTDNNIQFSLIPEHKSIYSKNFDLEYYGTIPILKPKKLPFERIETHIIKRIFDIVFSLLVCILLLSWLLPILLILVKLDSNGKFFFKQKRDGVKGKQFYCYKIRSMKNNDMADKLSTIEGDERVTRVGAFLRKTSLDELPQFFNVLLGDMSIVGPRPHMNFHTRKYEKEVANFLLRHEVKPGITGLAQISGYRGEVKKKSDIENRVRLDIFYIENWSFFLDVKIIAQTVFNIFKGQDKAY